MSTPTSKLVLASALVIPACAPQSAAPEGDIIPCAIGPGAEFEEVCTLEVTGPDEFVIHHPDGGFRRFLNDEDRQTVTSDGANGYTKLLQVHFKENGEMVPSMEVDGDRYLLTVEPFQERL